eukprot:8269785-Pyramimonas_sp.AAC.1
MSASLSTNCATLAKRGSSPGSAAVRAERPLKTTSAEVVAATAAAAPAPVCGASWAPARAAALT